MSLHIPASELAYQLPTDAAVYHLNYTLSLTLPPLPDDTPETLARRNHAIIARISGLRPTDAPQAEYAAQFVSPRKTGNTASACPISMRPQTPGSPPSAATRPPP